METNYMSYIEGFPKPDPKDSVEAIMVVINDSKNTLAELCQRCYHLKFNGVCSNTYCEKD